MAKNDFQYGWNSYTLQCGMWLFNDMQLNSPKRPPYCNSTFGFDFDHITAVDTSFCTSLAALFYSPVDSPMHQKCIRVMHV